jgi:hypothetical protein
MLPQVEAHRAPQLVTHDASEWTIPTAFVLSCAAVLIASFLKSDLSRNDFERFDDLRLLVLFFTLFLALCGVYIAAYVQRPSVSRRTMAGVALVSAALLLASFPVGSKDVFAYAFLGRTWGHYHANPYVVPPATFSGDPWHAFLSGQPFSVYGPLFLWQTWLVNAVAGHSLWLVVWLHKALATAVLLISVWVANALVSRTASNATGHAAWLALLLAWNPLVLYESAGAAHNDIVMVLLVLGAIWCWQADRFGTALGLLALSVWYKWYSIVFIPVFLIETLKTSGWRTAVRHAVVGAVAITVVGVVALSPLPGSLPTIVGEWLHPQKMRGIYPNELSPVLAAVFWSFRALGLFATDLGFRLFDLSRFALFGAAAVAVVIRQWRTAPSVAALTQGCCLIGLAAFMLLITQLWPWHLLTVIALGIVSGEEPFVIAAMALTVLGMLSYFLTFAVATVLLALVVAALWLLRRVGTAGV